MERSLGGPAAATADFTVTDAGVLLPALRTSGNEAVIATEAATAG